MLRGSWTLDLGDFADGKNDDTFPQIPVVLSQPRALLKSSRSNSRVWLNLLAGKFQYVYGTRAGEKQTYTKSMVDRASLAPPGSAEDSDLDSESAPTLRVPPRTGA